MPSLNDDLLRIAAPILEKYRAQLFSHRRFDTHSFEHDLRECWGAGYRTMKDYVVAMSGHGRFQEVAAYYMEHSAAPGVVTEFQPHLAVLYGVKYYHTPDIEWLRDQYWRRAFGE